MYALISGNEHRIALGCLAVIGVVASVIEGSRPLTTAFAAGFISAVLAIWTQVLFWGTYVINNPQFGMVELPFELSPTTFSILFSPIGGVVAGSISTLVALLTTRASSVASYFRRGNE